MKLPHYLVSSWLLVAARLVLASEVSHLQVEGSPEQPAALEQQLDIIYAPRKLTMNMHNSTTIQYLVSLNSTALRREQLESARLLELQFRPLTLAPQFQILHFNHTNSSSTSLKIVELSMEELRAREFTYNSTLTVEASYIGHASLELKAFLIYLNGTRESLVTLAGRQELNRNKLDITVVRHDGILDTVFMYSIIVFITITHINLGAQIDADNVRRLIDTPRIIFLGFLIGVLVMPSASWLAGHIFFQDQPMYRLGSFIYACGPAASASVLWTVMFNADKELALGLQIASTVGALFTMPILLYTMDKSLDLEGQYTIKVPYKNLGRTLVVLLIALLIGSRLVGRSRRAKQISQRIFRPLTMFVLLFIIVFSSIVYWYIYRMFNWTITLMALSVTSATYIVSGLLGYIIHKDLNHMITISISSTYRNSGIAFAALVVALQPPDIFIAYVPCLTQVVTTSLIGLVLYIIQALNTRLRKKPEM